MRYSQYFTKAAECCRENPQLAEQLIREAEEKANELIPIHLISCARFWYECRHHYDNAIRCLYRIECCTSDTRGLLEISDAYWEILKSEHDALRCLKKAIAAVEISDDKDRIAEFIAKYTKLGVNTISSISLT